MTWLRTQRRALIALLCTIVATVGVHVWLDVMPVAERENESIVIVSGGTAQIAGQELVLGDVRWDEFAAPADSRVLSVRFRASGGPDASMCGTVTLSEQHGERIWLDGDDLVDVPYEEGASYCMAESAPYDVISVFVVPTDARGPFFLDIAGEGRQVNRFPIEP